MCGFAGEFLFAPGRADLALALRMAERLRHRGPDEQGSFLSKCGRCAIGFRRLSVIDPPLSQQPMTSADGMLTVAFNGEIYNFRELRQELASQGAQFATAGDTEVLLHLYQRHGAAMLERLTGMFALALFDARRGELLLARDRMGEKPLWYAMLSDRIVFASEAKALLIHPAVPREVDAESILFYCSLGYIPAPRSIWRGVSKLQPAYHVVIQDRPASPVRYWQPGTVALPPSPAEQIQLVRDLVTRSVQARMVADVPLGALLSGGLDSSIVVGLMSKAAGRTGGVRTFTAGFEQELFDERPLARQVASHFGTQHTELLIRPRPSEMLDQVVTNYDEPFGDSSAVPTYLICQAAREHVTVALTGDGGDEMFGGYDRYRALQLADSMTPPKFLAAKVLAAMARLVAGHEERSRLRRFVRFADTLAQPPAQQYLTYRSLFSPQDLTRLLTPEMAGGLDLETASRWFCDLFEEGEFDDEVARAQHHDMMTYLPDDLLVKTDIASMASALELRAPLLDHELPPVGLSLPVDIKIHKGRGKHVLRLAFGDMLPPPVLGQSKRGFGVPLGDWLRKDLAQTMRDVLLDHRFIDRGLFKATSLAGLINDHVSGRDDHRHRLWALLVLARWFDLNS